MKFGASMMTLVCAAASCAVHAQLPEEVPPQTLGFSSDLEGASTEITEMRAKPARFDSFTDRLDFVHDNLQLNLQRYVDRVDTMMLDSNDTVVATPRSRFRIAPFIRLEDDSGIAFSFNPDFEAEVDLPNLERHWRVFIESSRGDQLPGVDRSEEDQSGQIGLRNVTRYIRTDVGVRFTWLPELFARAEWRTEWSSGRTLFHPRQRIFYETEDGYGSLTDLTAHRWFGRQNNLFWQSVSAARYASKGTEGYDLEQSLKLGLVRSTIEKGQTWRSVVSTEDLARGHILRYSLFGNSDRGLHVIERHRLTYTYRKPIYKKWIYLEVSPGYEVENETEWDGVPGITIGFDMLFWGTYER